MKRFYLAPTATVLDPATRPDAIFEAPSLPGDPATSLVVVEQWRTYAAEDAWKEAPGVEELPYYNWHLPPPAALRSAASAADRATARAGAAPAAAPTTIAEAMRLICRVWPGARP